MEASRNLVPKGTTLVLPADSELFGLLYDSNHYEHGAATKRVSQQTKKGVSHEMSAEAIVSVVTQ